MATSTPDLLPVKKIDPAATLPTRAHPGDAGLDLYALESATVAAGDGILARTGISLALPEGSVGLVADRSSMAKLGWKTLGGVIDAGYRGEIQIMFRNLSGRTLEFSAGERIAQLLILPIFTPVPNLIPHETADLNATSRGTGGFGSTGK